VAAQAVIDTYHRFPSLRDSRESGIIRTSSLPPGKHTFTITCVDYNGNTSEFSGTFEVRQRRSIVPEDSGQPSFSATDPPEYTIDPSRSGELLLERGMVRVRYQRNATFHPIHLILTPMNEKGSASFGIEPEGVPLDGGLTFVVKKPAWMNHAGVYTRDGPAWEFHSRAETAETGHVTFRLKKFLEGFSIREDSRPPEVRRLRIEGSGRRPRIFFRFRDNLAGVEYESLKLYIDETMIIPEIDGEHHRATAQPETSLSRGSHRLTIRLKDRMGNSTLVERSFRVP
jgi:hypothetical protein